MTPRIELHGDVTGNCLRAAIALEEAGLPWVARRVDLRAGAHKHADYLALNPEGKVPTLVDHRGPVPVVVSQSNAIVLHAAALAPGTLLAAAPGPEQARALQVFFYILTEVISVLFDSFQLARQQEIAGARLLRERGLAALAQAERHVAGAPFMAGDRFSIADIAALTITSAHLRHLPWDELPGLQRWYETVMARPAVQRGLRAFDPVDEAR